MARQVSARTLPAVHRGRKAQKKLLAFFGDTKPLADISEADAEDFSRYLLAEELADNTARRFCGRAKQFFRFAVRKRMIAANPFAELKSTVGSNPARQFFVTREAAEKVLDTSPNAEWRLIFALCRFGGLRCPSEVLGLRWQDIDWHRQRFTVRSPKTEHHEGKASRVVPIFPELTPYLADAFELANPGQEYVIERCRDSSINLRTQLGRIIRRAGLTPWPKPFHNLRASRQTELAERYPMHVVCEWIGNSAAVAQRHYLQVTEDHFAEAATRSKKAAQNQAQSGPDRPGQGWTEQPGDLQESPDNPALSLAGIYGPEAGLPPAGVEPAWAAYKAAPLTVEVRGRILPATARSVPIPPGQDGVSLGSLTRESVTKGCRVGREFRVSAIRETRRRIDR